jgi:hypothetical protein
VRNDSIAAGYTHNFSANEINELRFGFTRYTVDVTPNGYGTQPAAAVGIPGLNLDNAFTSGLPFFNILGDGGTELGYSLTANRCNCPLKERGRLFQVVDNFTNQAGNHSFKLGGDAREPLTCVFPAILTAPANLHLPQVIPASSMPMAPLHRALVWLRFSCVR